MRSVIRILAGAGELLAFGAAAAVLMLAASARL